MLLDKKIFPGGGGLIHFLIWPHGMRYQNEILGMIQEEKNSEIRHIVSQEKVSMAKLIRLVYSADKTPQSHLAMKLAYLPLGRQTVLHVFSQFNALDYGMTGIDRFRGPSALNVNTLKWRIRHRFNPKKAGGSHSHNHVVHAADSPSESLRVLASLEDNFPAESANPFEASFLGVRSPRHLEAPNSIRYLFVDPNDLHGKVWEAHRLVTRPIPETPHYRSFQEPDLYENYLAGKVGKEFRDGHSLAKFKSLFDQILNFGLESVPPLIARIDSEGRIVLLDGTHRAACALALGISSIRVAVFEGNQY